MPRGLLTLLSAVSLVLCVATAVLSVRSYWRCDLIAYTEHTATGYRIWSLFVVRGQFTIKTLSQNSVP